ncbi:MAG: methionine--tRNA ligase subunit beta [Candidatus Marsarchaeota archaeon]|jgi:methionine--tRNA ligase beta chain|nr:methionine--tRNA ligase subunit beta [Candidatus Marsarchaeota archaeon]
MDDIDSLMDEMRERELKDNVELKVNQQDSSASQADSDNSASNELQPERIAFDVFASVDLRVAKIIDVEDHESARKPMYKLRLDLGELGTRNIIAGIKAHYSKDELIGKSIVVVANLQARKIAGLLSDGMLLAAEDGGDIALIVPDRDFAPGSKIG